MSDAEYRELRITTSLTVPLAELRREVWPGSGSGEDCEPPVDGHEWIRARVDMAVQEIIHSIEGAWYSGQTTSEIVKPDEGPR